MLDVVHRVWGPETSVAPSGPVHLQGRVQSLEAEHQLLRGRRQPSQRGTWPDLDPHRLDERTQQDCKTAGRH